MARLAAGVLLYSAAVAEAWNELANPRFRTACLQYRGDGCHSIKDEETCLRSRDGSPWKKYGDVPIQGMRCVWCGGLPCTDKGPNLCGSLQWVEWWRGAVFKKKSSSQNFTAAICQDDGNINATMEALPPPMLLGKCEDCQDELRAAQKVDFVQLDGDGRACRGSHLADAGNRALPVQGEGSVLAYSTWSATSLGNCKALCQEKCYGVEYKEQDKYCEVWHRPVLFTVPAPGFQCYRKRDQAELNLLDAISQEDTSCLTERLGGCAALRDDKSCLSSSQGGSGCVWCGGALCGSADGALCTTRSFLKMWGIRQEALTPYKVADCKAAQNGTPAPLELLGAEPALPAAPLGAQPAGWGVPAFGEAQLEPLAKPDKWWTAVRPTEDEIECLDQTEDVGCNSLKDQYACLRSRDGRAYIEGWGGLKLRGEPCVWCGGGFCTSNHTNFCEPLDYLMHGEGRAFQTFLAKTTYRVAKCSASSKKKLMTQFQLGAVPRPLEAQQQCLQPQPAGCRSLTSKGACLTSRDGSGVPERHGLKVHNESCVWCNDKPCTTRSTSLCEPFDWLMNGEGKAFDKFSAKDAFAVAACNENNQPVFAPTGLLRAQPEKDFMTCLQPAPEGCNGLLDRTSCLSSRDGRPVPAVFDTLKIQGQPCVWCGGGSCHSGDAAKCEPYDFLLRGEGRAFETLLARKSMTVATCQGGEPVLKEDPRWAPARVSDAQMSCLAPQPAGCGSIKSAQSCVSSFDASNVTDSFGGLLVKGQPCTWCGGAPCTDKSSNLCEPYDYLLHGEGKAFGIFYAKGTFTVANCLTNGLPPWMGGPEVPTRAPVVPAADAQPSVLEPEVLVVPTEAPAAPTAAPAVPIVPAVLVVPTAPAAPAAAELPPAPTLPAAPLAPSTHALVGGCAGTQYGCCFDGTSYAKSVNDACKAALRLRFEQCGGQGWKGSTVCEAGTECLAETELWSACLPPKATAKEAELVKAKSEPVVAPSAAEVGAAQGHLMPAWAWLLIIVGMVACLVPLVGYAMGWFTPRSKRGIRQEEGSESESEVELGQSADRELEAPLVSEAASPTATQLSHISQVRAGSIVYQQAQYPPVASFAGATVQYTRAAAKP